MKRIYKNAILSMAVFLPVLSQAQLVKMPMDVAQDGTTYEQVSGKSFKVNGALVPYCVQGAKGKAWRLDGYSSYLQTQIDPTVISGKQQLTFSLWVAPESYPMMKLDQDGEWFTTMLGNVKLDDNNTISGDKGFAFQLGSRGSYKFICYVAGWPVKCEPEAKLSRYQWNHLVATVDGVNKKVTLYNNGELVASKNCSKGNITPGGSTLYVGKSYVEDKVDVFYLNTYNGLLDDFEIYDGIRTDIFKEKAENAPVLTYSPERYAGDILRPSFHGMPTAGWTNETHGATYYNGKYHVFFQKNPNGPYMSRLNWGHIVSDNLYKWEEDPTAISPEEAYDKKGCWSGCVFTDDELTGGKPNIFYTAVDYGRATIAQAQPADDDLLTWTKKAGNPVINGRPNGLTDDFRDCFVFRNVNDLYMIVGSSKNGVGVTTLHKYDKSTKTWSNDGKLFFSGSNANQDGTFWEMPNITKIGDKWLFTATPLNTGVGVRTLYWTGSINADGTFAPDSRTPKTVEMAGFSKDGYGLLSPTIFQKDGKTLMLGIVPDKLAGSENYKMGYAHTYSLPREISLDSKGNLIQKPFSGLAAMRSETSFMMTDFDLTAEKDLDPVQGRSLELSAKFVVGNGDFGFSFLGNGDKKVTLTYQPNSGMLSLDMSGINRIFNDGIFGGVYNYALPTPVAMGEEMTLKVFVDHSIIDIFVNDTYAASVRVFPRDVDAVKATAFVKNGSVKMTSLEAYVLDEKRVASGISSAVSEAETNVVYGSKGFVNYNLASPNCTLYIYDLVGICVKVQQISNTTGKVQVANQGLLLVKIVDNKQKVVGQYKVIV
jgi:beta-fructofuranosidase